MIKDVKHFFTLVSRWFNRPPGWTDAWILSFFTILVTWQPFYLAGRLDIVEWGIYLPGVQAWLDGAVPYRDFFHLRGPLEIIIPGLMMKSLGETIPVYALYFYAGTVLTLVFLVHIGSRLYRSRLLLYLMAIVVVAKTFPRVVFFQWGGMRYGWGLLAVLLAITAYRRNSRLAMAAAGLAAGAAFLTSVEVGICAMAGIAAGMVFLRMSGPCSGRDTRRDVLSFLTGGFLIGVPFLVYLLATGSLLPYIDTTWTVGTRMMKTFPDYLLGTTPNSFGEIIRGLINPVNDIFKYMTPGYCYLAFTGWLVLQIRRRKIHPRHAAVVTVAAYGLTMFVLSLRKVGAAQFEMALQPEKLILFFLCEEMYCVVKEQLAKNRTLLDGPSLRGAKIKAGFCYFLIFSLVGSSVIPAVLRYNKRFPGPAFFTAKLTGRTPDHLKPLKGERTITLIDGKAAGLTVPLAQAKDIAMLTAFFSRNTRPDEPVLMFPEYGTLNFIIDRPFIGRFPAAMYTWMNDRWHQENLSAIRHNPPRYATMSKEPEPTLKLYLKLEKNLSKYLELRAFIENNYSPVQSTPTQVIYRRNDIFGER